ncbi:unnamed protein product, partial [Adineta steineri]
MYILVHSWWPWRSSPTSGKCVLRTSDGWLKHPCQDEQAFICERDINRQSIPLTIHCGNVPSTTIPPMKSSITTTTIATIQHSSISFIQQVKRIEQLSTTIKTKSQTTKNNIDSNILAAIISGIAMVILSTNIVVCYLCKKSLQNQSKCKTQNESNISFTHEELQHSLMQHLYHEQTNTISSTSTSSSSSKHSQSKSNDTSTTITSPHFTNLSQINP